MGGYILGGGVNLAGTSGKLGLAAEHVISATLVTADGDIAEVEEYGTTITTTAGRMVREHIR